MRLVTARTRKMRANTKRQWRLGHSHLVAKDRTLLAKKRIKEPVEKANAPEFRIPQGVSLVFCVFQRFSVSRIARKLVSSSYPPGGKAINSKIPENEKLNAP